MTGDTPLRRSSRIKSNTQANVPNGRENKNDGATPSKRTKKNDTPSSRDVVKKRTKLKGRLANLPQMSLDILYEIFQLLEPLDLLRLARTSKDLRSILMKRSALTVWRRARANYVPVLPDCPNGVSEPAYANFMHTTNCYECHAAGASVVMPAHFARYCRKCVEDKVLWDVPENELVASTFKDLIKEFDYIPLQTYNLKTKKGLRPAALVSEFEEVRDQYLRIEKTMSAMADFVGSREQAGYRGRKWRNEFNEWSVAQKRYHAHQVCKLRSQRINDIESRLCAAGWTDTLTNMTPAEVEDFDENPFVKQAKPLTDRIWKNIEAEMIELMEKYQAERAKRERKVLITNRRSQFVNAVRIHTESEPVDAMMPSPADIYYMDEVKPLRKLLEEGPDTEETESALMLHFILLVAGLPELSKKWRSICTNVLLDIRNAGQPDRRTKATKTTLKRARTIFECTQCQQHVTYPAVLNHPCYSQGPFVAPSRYTLDERKDAKDLDSSRWLDIAPTKIKYDVNSAVRINHIITQCGMDPRYATQEDMDDDTVLIVHTTPNSKTLMGWRRAAKIICRVGVQPGHTWAREENEETLALLPQAETKFYTQDRLSLTLCVCTHCRNWTLSDELKEHMLKHKTGPVERKDFWVEPDSSVNALFNIPI